ncbi:MAG: nuclear transport factor 2 family protein [Myxococcota bacterium]
MLIHFRPLLLACAIAAFPVTSLAQTDEEAIHDDLRQLRDQSLEAIEQGDFDALAEHIHPNIVLTAENGTVVRGRDAIQSFYEETLLADDSFLETFEVRDFEVDELSIIYGGDTAIAFGSAKLHYVPRAGSPLTEAGRWSATMVKEDDRWLLANFQTTVDFTSSEFVGAAVTQSSYLAGGAGAVLGLLLGAGVMALLRRRKE